MKKILIDIGHPAHVHYFRNFISIMENKGYEFKIVARDKEVTHRLLDSYNIKYISRGAGSNGLIGKLKYLFTGTKFIYQASKEFNPEYLLSFASPYAALTSKILSIPHITLDDTDHASLSHKIYSPFTEVILNPVGFKVTFKRSKQIFFNSFTELMYLHPKYYTPKINVCKLLELDDNQSYVILRFVSWNANHDINALGLSDDDKLKLVNYLRQYSKVFITSESDLPDNLKKYQLKVPVDEMHDVLANATLFIGESGTMTSECAVLGVPNIQIRNTIDETKVPAVHLKLVEKDLKILKKSNDLQGIIECASEILNNVGTVTEDYQQKKEKLINETDDLNEILVDIIDGYPDSLLKY